VLSVADAAAIDFFDDLRQREFSRLDEQDIAYLDFAATALYGASQADAYAERLRTSIYGNPHSEHGPSRASEADLAAARRATLDYFDADPDLYDVCFTANTSAAIKLVAESYSFGAGQGLVLSADNHNSVNGMREFARRAEAAVAALPLDAELRLEDPLPRLRAFATAHGAGLFAFPLQSNFSGVRHSLDLVADAQRLGFHVLIDAAGCCIAGDISLRRHPAEFLAFSYYKLFGLPTGVGALIVRRDALKRLKRPWFAGGTVDFVSIAHDRHQLSAGHAGFEDGTPNFLNAGAVLAGFDLLGRLPTAGLQARLKTLAARFIARASALRHRDGAPLVRIYGPAGMNARGGTVAFNVLRRNGDAFPYQLVEHAARGAGLAIRGGCFCNPGAAERAFDFDRHDINACLDALGESFTVAGFQERLGPRATVGALRLSVGVPTNVRDIDRAVDLLMSLADEERTEVADARSLTSIR
jgi:selenocysteine lyase/cysteine desulfurase